MEDRKSIEETIKAVAKSFGHPHRHDGLGIRDLGRPVYECRWSGAGRGGVELRLVFLRMTSRPTTLMFDMMGDHAAVRKYLKQH